MLDEKAWIAGGCVIRIRLPLPDVNTREPTLQPDCAKEGLEGVRLQFQIQIAPAMLPWFRCGAVAAAITELGENDRPSGAR